MELVSCMILIGWLLRKHLSDSRLNCNSPDYLKKNTWMHESWIHEWTYYGVAFLMVPLAQTVHAWPYFMLPVYFLGSVLLNSSVVRLLVSIISGTLFTGSEFILKKKRTHKSIDNEHFFISWPWPLTYDLDRLAKIQGRVSVCLARRVRRTHTHTTSKLLHPSI